MPIYDPYAKVGRTGAAIQSLAQDVGGGVTSYLNNISSYQKLKADSDTDKAAKQKFLQGINNGLSKIGKSAKDFGIDENQVNDTRVKPDDFAHETTLKVSDSLSSDQLQTMGMGGTSIYQAKKSQEAYQGFSKTHPAQSGQPANTPSPAQQPISVPGAPTQNTPTPPQTTQKAPIAPVVNNALSNLSQPSTASQMAQDTLGIKSDPLQVPQQPSSAPQQPASAPIQVPTNAAPSQPATTTGVADPLAGTMNSAQYEKDQRSIIDAGVGSGSISGTKAFEMHSALTDQLLKNTQADISKQKLEADKQKLEDDKKKKDQFDKLMAWKNVGGKIGDINGNEVKAINPEDMMENSWKYRAIGEKPVSHGGVGAGNNINPVDLDNISKAVIVGQIGFKDAVERYSKYAGGTGQAQITAKILTLDKDFDFNRSIASASAKRSVITKEANLQALKVDAANSLFKIFPPKLADGTYDEKHLTPQMATEMAIAAARLVSPTGQIAENLVHELKQNTAQENISRVMGFFGVQDGGTTQLNLQNIEGFARREGQLAKKARDTYLSGSTMDLEPPSGGGGSGAQATQKPTGLKSDPLGLFN